MLIPRLRTMRISWNFLKVIGQHRQASGLKVMWIESDLLGGNTTEHTMSGKDYAKGPRAHKITPQAMCQMFQNNLLQFAELSSTTRR